VTPWSCRRLKQRREKAVKLDLAKRGRLKQIEKRKKIKIDCLLSFFFLQITVVVTAGEEKKRGRSRSRPPCCWVFLVAAREPTRKFSIIKGA
jgi:hypothetical protein